MLTKSLKDLVHFDPEDVRREALFETDNLFSEVLCFDGKQHVGPLLDEVSDALFTVLAGEGRFNVGRRSRSMRQWGSVLVPAGSEVTVINLHDEPLVVLMVASPPPGGGPEAEEDERDERPSVEDRVAANGDEP
jgi:mannose-6-phosphate isomerase-like protein (cupin superfamily)